MHGKRRTFTICGTNSPPDEPPTNPGTRRYRSRHPHLGQSHHHLTTTPAQTPNVVETPSSRMPPDLVKHKTTRQTRVRPNMTGGTAAARGTLSPPSPKDGFLTDGNWRWACGETSDSRGRYAWFFTRGLCKTGILCRVMGLQVPYLPLRRVRKTGSPWSSRRRWW